MTEDEIDTGKLDITVVDDPTPLDRPRIDLAAPAPVPTLEECVIAVAREAVGIRESPPGSNSGPGIDEYLYNVGLLPGQSWCAAAMYSWFLKAARACGQPNPFPRTGGCLRAWSLADDHYKIASAVVARDPTLLKSGMVAVEDHGNGLGHVALVTGPADPNVADLYPAISGNTNAGGSRNGDGVYSQHRRISAALGFLDFSRLPEPPSVT